LSTPCFPGLESGSLSHADAAEVAFAGMEDTEQRIEQKLDAHPTFTSVQVPSFCWATTLSLLVPLGDIVMF